jgi:hypothetical protein
MISKWIWLESCLNIWLMIRKIGYEGETSILKAGRAVPAGRQEATGPAEKRVGKRVEKGTEKEPKKDGGKWLEKC